MEIMPIKQYYDTYPEKRPSNYGQPYTDVKSLTEPSYSWDEIQQGSHNKLIAKTSKTSHIEAMIRDFKQTNNNPNNPLLKAMEKRLKQLKKDIVK